MIDVNYNRKDATLFRWPEDGADGDDIWFLFDTDETNQVRRLYYQSGDGDDLLGSWTEHPSSPIISDSTLYRNAGRPIVNDDSIFMWSRDDTDSRVKIRGVTVTDLSTSTYADSEWPTPVTRQGESRNPGGNLRYISNCHHVDPLSGGIGGAPPLIIGDGKFGPNGDWVIYAMEYRQ